MSFFSSVRRQSVTAGASKEEATEETTTRQRRHSSPKKRQNIPWNDVEIKIDESSSLKTSIGKEGCSSKADSSSLEHKGEFPTVERDVKDTQQQSSRGRLPSWTKPHPFSSLRGRSRSRSASSSPTRNLFHKAAELVRDPTAFFNKGRTSEDSTKPLKDASPTKTLRSKKSVHFSSDEDKDGPFERGSPKSTPSQLAPSLPPFNLSSPELLNIGDGNPAAPTARPPATPIIKGLAVESVCLSPCLGPIVSPGVKENSCDDRAGSSSIDIPNAYDVDITALAALQEVGHDFGSDQTSIPPCKKDIPTGNDERRERHPERASESLSARQVGSSSRLTPPNTSLPSSGHPKNKAGSEEVNAPSEGIGKLTYTSFPLRSKLSKIEAAVQDNQSPQQDAEITAAHCAEAMVLRTDSFLPNRVSKESAPSRGRTSRKIGTESYSQQSDPITTAEHPASSEATYKPQTTIGRSSPKHGSRSPSRRRFRFENRAESTSEGRIVSPLAANEVSSNGKGKQYMTRDACTPSPSKVPLPMSARPNQREDESYQAGTYRDQDGWSPFTDERFVDEAALMMVGVGDSSFIELMCIPGGFAHFWYAAGLEEKNAPNKNTKVLSREEAEQVVEEVIVRARHRLSALGLQRDPEKSPPPARKLDIRGQSPTEEEFFGDIMFDDIDTGNKGTHKISDDTKSSGKAKNSESACQQPGCLCSPCECKICTCGTDEAESIIRGKISGPTVDCTCDPCWCRPCRCGLPATEDEEYQPRASQPISYIAGNTCNCKHDPCICGMRRHTTVEPGPSHASNNTVLQMRLASESRKKDDRAVSTNSEPS